MNGIRALTTRQFMQIALYVCFGLLQLGIDWLVFVGLTAAGVAVPFANVSSRLIAAFAGYAFNGLFTFRRDDTPVLGKKAFRRYCVLWCALTLISTMLVYLVEHRLSLKLSWIAKPIVEATLAIVSFLTMKSWVYR
jgi:putative flippase GtrA